MIKVAIVDDHKILTEGLQGLIAESGLATVVGVAHSAEQCRLSIGFWKPDVLLLDVGLPDISGIDFCKELKEAFPDIAILALTTHDEYSIVRQMLANGASGYVIKNALPDEILAGIEAVANGQIFLCHEIDVLMKKPAEKNIWLTER